MYFSESLLFKYAERQTEVMQSQEITNENKGEDQKRQHFADSAFGCNPQPVLEKVEFKVCRMISNDFSNLLQTLSQIKIVCHSKEKTTTKAMGRVVEDGDHDLTELSFPVHEQTGFQI